MCKVKSFSQKMLDQIQMLLDTDKEYAIMLSELDKEINNIYHDIEFSNFNACEGFYKAKKLKDTLRKRREVKLEQAKIHSLKVSININDIKSKLIKIHTNVDKQVERHQEKYPSLRSVQVN